MGTDQDQKASEEIAALKAEIERLKQVATGFPLEDSKIVDFLAKRFIGPDFRYGDPAAEVVVIEMPKGCSYTGDLRRDITAAMAKGWCQMSEAIKAYGAQEVAA